MSQVSRAAAIVGLLLLAGCPKKDEPKKEEPKKQKPAEVEFFGSITQSAVPAAKTIFVALQEPCLPLPAEVHLLGKAEISGEKLFAEFWPPQGSVGHVCAFGLDAAGKVISAATYGKNPVKFEGEGEIIVDHVDLKLEALGSPAASPKGL